MNNLLTKKTTDIVDSFIIFYLFLFVLSLEALKTLLGIFTYGFLRKEILTTKSNSGIDITIKMK